MVNSKEQACINILLKYPDIGYVKTRLAAEIGDLYALKVYENCIFDISKTLKKINIPVNIFCAPASKTEILREWMGNSFYYYPQEGKDLGERMKNSLIKVFAKGRRKALIIGGDMPDISDLILREAVNMLENHDAVIGPSSDGGYYLIGFTADGFKSEFFEGIKWSSSEVYRQTLNKLYLFSLKVGTLIEGHDIDTLKDLKDFYKRNSEVTDSVLKTYEYIKKNRLLENINENK